MTDKLTAQQKVAIALASDRLHIAAGEAGVLGKFDMGNVQRLTKLSKLEMYKRLYNVTNNRVVNREPEPQYLKIGQDGETVTVFFDEADDLPSLVGFDYSALELQVLGLQDWPEPEPKSVYRYEYGKPLPGTVGRTNHKAIAKRRKANKAARKARAKAR